MIGKAIGVGAGLVGGFMSANKMRKAYKNYIKSLERQKDDAADMYMRNYSQDATMRSDAQRLLNMTDEASRKRTEEANATNAVMGGGTAAQQAAIMQANANASADVAGRINTMADARKDAVEANYTATKQSLDNKINEAKLQRGQQQAQSIANATDALTSTMLDYV